MAENTPEKYTEKVGGIEMHNVSFDDLNFEMAFCDMEEMYRSVLHMRFMEERTEKMYADGLIRGFCHLDIGQEGVYSGFQYMKGNDKFIGSYRCHALALGTGTSIREAMGELLGREGGIAKGKGGSMHLYNESMYGGHGIVGAQVPLGCGIAYALKYRENPKDIKDTVSKSAVFCFYGDGASNQGQIHESFNMAQIWRLPIVFVVVNNKYGMWTPALNVCANEEYYKRCDFLPGVKVSAQNVFAVVRCLELCRQHALEEGPIILQIDTYRFCGHSTTDKVTYRNESEIDSERAMDVVRQLENVLSSKLGAERVDEIKAAAKSFVEAEIDVALKMAEPSETELRSDVIKG